MLSLLKEYKRQHGDCNVPYPWPENPKLKWWVHNQRSAKKAGKKKASKLTEEQIHRLTEMDFKWVIQKNPRVVKNSVKEIGD
jgi:hypothetical protein